MADFIIHALRDFCEVKAGGQLRRLFRERREFIHTSNCEADSDTYIFSDMCSGKRISPYRAY